MNRNKIKRYLHHEANCKFSEYAHWDGNDPQPCTCGLDKVLRSLSAPADPGDSEEPSYRSVLTDALSLDDRLIARLIRDLKKAQPKVTLDIEGEARKWYYADRGYSDEDTAAWITTDKEQAVIDKIAAFAKYILSVSAPAVQVQGDGGAALSRSK